jgi:hypothetical protein
MNWLDPKDVREWLDSQGKPAWGDFTKLHQARREFIRALAAEDTSVVIELPPGEITSEQYTQMVINHLQDRILRLQKVARLLVEVEKGKGT